MERWRNGPNLLEWLQTFRKRVVPILAGGVAVTIGLYEHWIGNNISWGISCTIAVGFGFWACYLAWKDMAIELRKSQQAHAVDLMSWNRERDKEKERLAVITKNKRIEEELLEHLSAIAARRVEIKQMGGTQYEARMAAAKDQQDKASIEVVNKTYAYLLFNINQTEADLWVLASGFPPIAEKTENDRHDKMLHFLTQYEIRLKGIIEKYRS